MSFAYVVNKNSSTGTLTDEAGKFSIAVKTGDTLSFSYLGYGVTKVFTHPLKDSIRNNSLRIRVFLKPKASELKPVIISDHSFTKEEKEYYKRKVDEYKRVIGSPFTTSSTGAGLNIDALYYMWSKKGKELQKLSEIYRQLMIDEIKEHRLSDQKIRMLTGNDTLNVNTFKRNCYLPDQFVISASDYDLFYAVKQCYRQYMDMQRRKK